MVEGFQGCDGSFGGIVKASVDLMVYVWRGGMVNGLAMKGSRG